MSNRNKNGKDELIVVGLFAAITLIALIVNWWKQHQILGWVGLISIIALVAFVILKPRISRHYTNNIIQPPTNGIVYGNKAQYQAAYKDKAPVREPLPLSIRKEVHIRAQNHCENESCGYNGILHIHHIDMDNKNNRLFNLIALCPNCHSNAHEGLFKETQLHNWMNRDYHRLKARRNGQPSSLNCGHVG